MRIAPEGAALGIDARHHKQKGQGSPRGPHGSPFTQAGAERAAQRSKKRASSTQAHSRAEARQRLRGPLGRLQTAPSGPGRLEAPLLDETQDALAGDDEVIQDAYLDEPQRFDQTPGDELIGVAHVLHATRVIVQEHAGGRALL